MMGNGRREHMEKPLLGAVLCCTAVPPEQRTRFADIITELGGEHKLDLTSDVTHLLVEVSDALTAVHLTAKYKYVAANREDIRVLQPAWLEAVRQAWMTGEKFSVQALEARYKLPIFAGLAVCLTGFDNLAFRAQLQEHIVAHGGDYRGDLTKSVTHLIANAPEGKKYQYAEQWHVRVVGLRWLQDSLHRGMVLEESLYHPTLPLEEQGKGAWHRDARAEAHLRKRPRDEKPPQEAPRKLRRTASSKLGSQSDNLWEDIMGGGFDSPTHPDLPVQSSKLRTEVTSVVLEPESFITEDARVDQSSCTLKDPCQRPPNALPNAHQGYFSQHVFLIQGFPPKNRSVLRNVLKENGAVLVDSLIDMSKLPGAGCGLFVIVPYCMPESDIPSVEWVHPTPGVVTDMWIERCLAYQTYLDPEDHPAGTPVGRFPIAGFGDLKINSTGFENIELLHLSKLVRLGGATYDETLQPEISVLLCNKTKANPEKQRYARAWGIPVVSDAWLWACLRSGQLKSFDAYTVPARDRGEKDLGGATREETTLSQVQDGGQEPEDARNQERTDKLRKPYATERKMRGIDELTSRRQTNSGQPPSRPGADFLENPAPPPAPPNEVGATTGRAHGQNPKSKQHLGTWQPSPDHDTEVALPSQELSNHSPPKGPESSAPKKKKRPLFRPFDGNGSAASTAMSNDAAPAAPAPTSTGKTEYVPPQTDSINDAIHDLLNMTSKARASAPSASQGAPKRTRLLGRALSNMSNTSRQSRASSVDSLNTDGVGSVIGAEEAHSEKPKSSIGRTGSFTGRAKAKAASKNGPLMDPVDPGLCRDEFADEEPTPPMTQLGYGEHEDAVKIREKLAEKRRNRARQGQETFPVGAEKKRLKDDEAILGAGWGVGGRTRQKDHSAKGMEGF